MSFLKRAVIKVTLDIVYLILIGLGVYSTNLGLHLNLGFTDIFLTTLGITLIISMNFHRIVALRDQED